jgi:hypothetical protein
MKAHGEYRQKLKGNKGLFAANPEEVPEVTQAAPILAQPNTELPRRLPGGAWVGEYGGGSFDGGFGGGW